MIARLSVALGGGGKLKSIEIIENQVDSKCVVGLDIVVSFDPGGPGLGGLKIDFCNLLSLSFGYL